MTAYRCDGTTDGILCCLFRAFSQKEEPYAVFSDCFQPSFDTVVVYVPTDEKTAERVAAGIIKNCSRPLLENMVFAARSGDPLKETVIFRAVKKCLEKRADITADLSDYDMLAFHDLIERIRKEIHRFKGFLRFSECEGGGLYAHFEPDNDVSDLLVGHFKKRFSSDKFIIHDVKRNVIVVCDGKTHQRIALSGGITVTLSQGEKNFNSLWKTYFDSVSIKERKNTRQQDNYLPRRYRKNMTEFN